MGRTHARRPRRALAASAVFGMVAGSLATMGPAHGAVMLSGSVIDSAGNYVAATVQAYDAATGNPVASDYADAGAFDIALPDGTYKLRVSPLPDDLASEYYRDKADLATADVVTVAGAAQTLPAWTVDALPSITGVVRTADGRPVRNASVAAYDTAGAAGASAISYETADGAGNFRIGSTVASVKLVFSGSDPTTGKPLATEWYSDKTSKETADAVAPTPAGTNVGVITLAPAGSISGRVTNEAGAPLYYAQVCSDDGNNDTRNDPCDVTDSNGAYTIQDVRTGQHTVYFHDPIGEYVGEAWNNVTGFGQPTPVTVAPGQAVTGIDAALAAAPAPTPPNGVDVSGTVRDELGGLGIGYYVSVYNTPADPRDKKLVASTITDRSGQYHFAQLDRIGGETEFKIVVHGQSSREEADFARRDIWSGNKLGYDSAVAITAAPRTLDFVQPVAGGVAGTITSEAGGVPEDASATFYDAEGVVYGSDSDVKLDGTYDERNLWAGTYTVQLAADDHVAEWWNDAVAGRATTITVKPGQMVTGISAVLAKDVKAIDRPAIVGEAWVGKTLTLDKGAWNAEAGTTFTYEWLVGSTVVGTGPSLTLTTAHLGQQVVGRVTNDAGFSIGQAISESTLKVGYQPKLKTKVSSKKIELVLKAKPVRTKKVKAKVTVYLVKGTNADGEQKLKKLGKAKVKKGKGVVKLKKALKKGKHTLVFRIAGQGKVGSGDLVEKVKIKR